MPYALCRVRNETPVSTAASLLFQVRNTSSSPEEAENRKFVVCWRVMPWAQEPEKFAFPCRECCFRAEVFAADGAGVGGTRLRAALFMVADLEERCSNQPSDRPLKPLFPMYPKLVWSYCRPPLLLRKKTLVSSHYGLPSFLLPTHILTLMWSIFYFFVQSWQNYKIMATPYITVVWSGCFLECP